MIYANVGRMKDPLKQNLALEFSRNQNKRISILTESHINRDQRHHIRNNWWAPSFSLLESHTEGLLVLPHPDHTDHTDPKGRFLSFKITPSDDRVFCVYAPSGHSTRKQLTRGRFSEGLQDYMENKNKGNESKIIVGEFNCNVDKLDWDGGSKTQRKMSFQLCSVKTHRG